MQVKQDRKRVWFLPRTQGKTTTGGSKNSSYHNYTCFKLLEPEEQGTSLLGENEFLSRPTSKPAGCVLQLWVKVKGYSSKVLAVHDGGAEVAMMSSRLYHQMQPKPELRPSSDTIRGLYGPYHSPQGKCTVQVEIAELGIIVEYDVVVDDIEEDLLIDAGMMHHAGVQCKYDTQEIVRKNKVVKGVARVRRRGLKARRVTLVKDWVIQPKSRQLVPGKTSGVDKTDPHSWIVESSKLISQQQCILVAKSLCKHSQAMGEIPVEVYNPTDEPVQLSEVCAVTLRTAVTQ